MNEVKYLKYQYDKESDTIYHKEVLPSYPSEPVEKYHKVDYDHQELIALREAILGDRSDYSASYGLNPILRHNNTKPFQHNKFELMDYELFGIYQNLLAEQLLGTTTDNTKLDLPVSRKGLLSGDFGLWEGPLNRILYNLPYMETQRIAHQLVSYLKSQENWNIKDTVIEDGIMKLYRDADRPWVK